MLHAELHGKIAADADDAERREDVLTSTVFGTLFTAGAWDLLLAWLGQARPIGHAVRLEPEVSNEQAYWFWPRLHGAEPDLVIRAGARLIVVEAKYRSGKSGAGSTDATAAGPEETSDQLVREWRACSASADMAAYPEPIRQAIRSCRLALVYLVRRSRWAHELRAVEKSAAQNPAARMYLLTWEDLDDVLATSESRWAHELRTYLYRRDLAAFRGFRRALSPTGAPIARLEAWRSGSSPAEGPPFKTWPRVLAPGCLPRLASLAAWAPRFTR